MARKLSLLIGFGAGYVLGARSGRERYDQLMRKAQQVWHDPRVQEKAGQAQHLVQEKAGEAGQAVKDKVASATSSHGTGASEQPGTGPTTTS
jgi:hypothetical protein